MEEFPEQFLEKAQKFMCEIQKNLKNFWRARHVYFFDFRISTMKSMSHDTHRGLRRCGRAPRTILRKSSKIYVWIPKKNRKSFGARSPCIFFDFRISTMQNMSYDSDMALRRCRRVPEQLTEKAQKSMGECRKKKLKIFGARSPRIFFRFSDLYNVKYVLWYS